MDRRRGIILNALMIGRVERLNGTGRREFSECHEEDLDLPTLQATPRAWA